MLDPLMLLVNFFDSGPSHFNNTSIFFSEEIVWRSLPHGHCGHRFLYSIFAFKISINLHLVFLYFFNRSIFVSYKAFSFWFSLSFSTYWCFAFSVWRCSYLKGMIRFMNAISYFFDTFQQHLLSPELLIMNKHFLCLIIWMSSS